MKQNTNYIMSKINKIIEIPFLLTSQYKILTSISLSFQKNNFFIY